MKTPVQNIENRDTGSITAKTFGFVYGEHSIARQLGKHPKTFVLNHRQQYAKSRLFEKQAATSFECRDHISAYGHATTALKADLYNYKARQTFSYILQAGGYGDEALEQYELAKSIERNTKQAETQCHSRRFLNTRGSGPMVMMRNNIALQQSLNGGYSGKADISQLEGLRHLQLESGKGKRALGYFARIAWMILFLLCVSPGLIAQSLEEPITISGQVSSTPHPAHPTTTVKAKDPQTGYTYGSTTTDANGNYSLELIITGVEAWHTQQPQTKPNPFAQSTQLSYQAKHTGQRTLRVLNALGQTILQQEFYAGQGDVVSIDLHGLGEAGTYFAHISSAQGTESFKLLQAQMAYHKQVEINVQAAGSSLKSTTVSSIRLVYEADDHQQKDTLVSQQNHSGVDVTISQIPAIINSQYSITLTNDVMNQGVVASVQVRNHETSEVLFSGTSSSSGVFSRSFQNRVWEWPGEVPIYEINSLRSNASAQHHNNLQRVDAYSQNMSLSSVMTQIAYNGDASLSVNLNSLPLGYGPSGALVDVSHNGSSVANGSTNNGSASINIPYVFYQNGSAVLNMINGSPVSSLDMDVSHAIHEPAQFSRAFSSSMSLNENIYQIPEQGSSDFTINVTSLPFNYGPSGASVVLVDDDTSETLDSGSTSNGVFNGVVNFEFWQHGSLYQATVNNVGVDVSLSNHSSFNDVFPNVTQTIPVTLNQNPSVGSTTIDLFAQNIPFNYGITGANAVFRNQDNNQIINQGTTVNGNYQANISFNYWEHEGDVISELENISYEVTKSNHQGANGVIPNVSQPLNVTLEQIAQNATANISGQVTDASNGSAINQALVEVLNHNNTNISQTNSNAQGNHSQNVNYDLWVNETNPSEKITFPPHIKLRYSKQDYETVTTGNLNLQASVVHNQALEPNLEPQVLNFTFKPITVVGDPQNPGNVYKFVFGDQVHSVTVGSQTAINVNMSTTLPATQVKIWHEPPSENNKPVYNEAVMIAHQNRPWHETAFANNNMTPNRVYNNQPFDTLFVSVADLNNKHNLEIMAMPNYFDHPVLGVLHTNEAPIGQIMSTKAGGYIFQHEPFESYNHFEILHCTFNLQNGNQMPQVVTDAWDYGLIKSLNASTRNDGQKTFDWQIYYVNSFDHPKYVEAQNRNFRNSIRVASDSNTPNPVNSTTFVQPVTLFLINSGIARGPPAPPTQGQALEETYEAMYALGNPQTTNSGAIMLDYYSGPNWDINDIGKHIIQYRNQLKKGSRLNMPPQTTSQSAGNY